MSRMPMFTRVVLGLALVFLPLQGAVAAKGAEERDAAYDYLLAEEAARRNDLPTAIAHLDRAIEKEPNQSYLWYKRATFYIALGDLPKAEGDVGRALQLSPRDLPSLILLGKIRQGEERWREAAEVYLRALAVDPDSEEVHLLLVENYVAAKNLRAASNLVQSWERRKPESVVPLFYQAWLYQNFLKNPSRVIAAYEKILNLEPDNLKALSALAEIYMNRKEETRLLEVFRRMEAVAPQDVSVQLKMALLYYEHKRYEEAIRKFRELLHLHPEADRIIYYLGVLYENLKRDAEAFGEFTKIRPDSGFYRDARLHMAYLKVRGEKREEAIRILEEALRVKSGVGSFYEYLSEIYRDLKDYPKAIAVLRKGLARSPEKEALHYSLGVVYDRVGRFEECLRSMKAVLRLNPKNANALNYIGYSYADRGIHLEEAMELVQKALVLKPDDGYITDSLGWVHFQKGNLEEAMVYVRKAYQMVPQEPTITEHLGDIWMKKGEKAKALRYLKEALSVLEKRDDPETAKDRERLKEKIKGLRDS